MSFGGALKWFLGNMPSVVVMARLETTVDAWASSWFRQSGAQAGIW